MGTRWVVEGAALASLSAPTVTGLVTVDLGAALGGTATGEGTLT